MPKSYPAFRGPSFIFMHDDLNFLTLPVTAQSVVRAFSLLHELSHIGRGAWRRQQDRVISIAVFLGLSVFMVRIETTWRIVFYCFSILASAIAIIYTTPNIEETVDALAFKTLYSMTGDVNHLNQLVSFFKKRCEFGMQRLRSSANPANLLRQFQLYERTKVLEASKDQFNSTGRFIGGRFGPADGMFALLVSVAAVAANEPTEDLLLFLEISVPIFMICALWYVIRLSNSYRRLALIISSLDIQQIKIR